MRRRPDKLGVKSLGLTRELLPKLFGLSSKGGSGIPSVEVKFVDIGRNTGSESDYLVRY